jgi:hypothetical protein
VVLQPPGYREYRLAQLSFAQRLEDGDEAPQPPVAIDVGVDRLELVVRHRYPGDNIDFTDDVDGSNHLVVLDILTGDELLRIPTPATRATIGTILLLSNGDVYRAPLRSSCDGLLTSVVIRTSQRS